MKQYIVGFNNDGILVTEKVNANDPDDAKIVAQPLHPDLPIIFVKLVKP